MSAIWHLWLKPFRNGERNSENIQFQNGQKLKINIFFTSWHCNCGLVSNLNCFPMNSVYNKCQVEGQTNTTSNQPSQALEIMLCGMVGYWPNNVSMSFFSAPLPIKDLKPVPLTPRQASYTLHQASQTPNLIFQT